MKNSMDDMREKTEYALKLIKQGKSQGVELLYSAASGRMLSVAVGIVKNLHTAEDIVQDSFIKIVENASSYRLASNGYAWVLKIVRNTALNKLKYESCRKAENIDEYSNLASNYFSPEKVDNTILVNELMAHLSSEHRKVIYMKYFLDMTVREIAKELGVSKSLIHKRIQEAEKAMKEKI